MRTRLRGPLPITFAQCSIHGPTAATIETHAIRGALVRETRPSIDKPYLAPSDFESAYYESSRCVTISAWRLKSQLIATLRLFGTERQHLRRHGTVRRRPGTSAQYERPVGASSCVKGMHK